ncbi:MAG: hypothetical protein ACKOAU_19730, partial [Pirellula sp.]
MARQQGKTPQESGIYLKLPGDIARVDLDRLTIDFNSTGHAVDEDITVTNPDGSTTGIRLTVPLGTKANPFMQVEIINLQLFIGPTGNEFFELSGDFGFRKDQNAIVGVARNANIVFKVGANELSTRQTTLGLQINPDGGIAFDGIGTPTIRLPGFLDTSVQRLRVGYNSTGAAFVGELQVGEIKVPMNLMAGDKSVPFVLVIALGFQAKLGEFLSISGDFAFQRTGTRSGGDITVASTDVNASFDTPAFRLGVILGNLGLIVKADGGVALSVSGEPFLVFKSGFSVDDSFTLQGVGFEWNSTGASVDQTLVGGFEKRLQLPIGTQANPFVSAIVTGLKIKLKEFASLSGDFAFQYRNNGDIAVVADNTDATISIGQVVRGGVTNAKLALLIKNSGTFAVQTTGGAAFLNLGNGLAQVSVQEMGFSYNNTGADIDEQLDMSAFRISVSLRLNVKNEVTTVVVNGLEATVPNFVRIQGDFAIRKVVGPGATDDQLIVLTRNATAIMSLGSQISLGVRNTTMALVINEDQTFILQATGLPEINLGNRFDPGVSATTLGVSYNNTGRDVDQTYSINVGDVVLSIPVKVDNDVATVLAMGFQATIVNFVSISGDFAFQKRPATGDEPASLYVVANRVNASLNLGTTVQAGVFNATLAMIITQDGKIAMQASGGSLLDLGDGFLSASSEYAVVVFNDTGRNIEKQITLKINDAQVTAPLFVADGQVTVEVMGLTASVDGILTVSGNFAFNRTKGSSADKDELIATATDASATLAIEPEVRAGVRDGDFYLKVLGNETLTLSVSGNGWMDIGPGTAVAVVENLSIDFSIADVLTGNQGITGFSQVPGKIDQAKVLSVTVTGASLFVGTGGLLNTDHTAVETQADAVGFLASNASFKFAAVTKGDAIFVGMEASVVSAVLKGTVSMDARVSGKVKVNASINSNGQRIDWDSATTLPSTPTNILPALSIDQTVQVSASGAGSLNVDQGTLVAVVQSIDIYLVTIDVDTGNPSIKGFSVQDGLIEDAQVLTVSMSGASLFVGSGGKLTEDRTGVEHETDAVGFLVQNASVDLAFVIKSGVSFAGLEVSLDNATLLGVSAVDAKITGKARVNYTSASSGARIDWDSATKGAGTSERLHPELNIDKAVTLSASGSGSLDIDSGTLVAVVQGVTLNLATADVLTGNPLIGADGTIAGAEVFTVEIDQASLFVGQGGLLSQDRSSVETKPDAVGFLAEQASLKLAMVTKAGVSYLGLDVSAQNAKLLGLSLVDVQLTGHVFVNDTSLEDGERIDWDSAVTNGISSGNLLPTLAIDKSDQIRVKASGSLDIGPGIVVAVVDELTLDMVTMNLVTGNDQLGDAGTISDAQVLSFRVNKANLYVGNGGKLNETRTQIQTEQGAVGFLVTDAAFALV